MPQGGWLQALLDPALRPKALRRRARSPRLRSLSTTVWAPAAPPRIDKAQHPARCATASCGEGLPTNQRWIPPAPLRLFRGQRPDHFAVLALR